MDNRNAPKQIWYIVVNGGGMPKTAVPPDAPRMRFTVMTFDEFKAFESAGSAKQSKPPGC